MIYYSIPYDSNKNIGSYYNKFASMVPEEDYICFIDADTIFTTSDYGSFIEDIVRTYPDIEAFTCYTNRVGCPWQVAADCPQGDNYIEHREFGRKMQYRYGLSCMDCTNLQLFSGMFLLIKKSAWTKIGGAKENGMLAVDNDIHAKLQRNGMKLYLIQGLYIYHYYRGGNKDDISHLTMNKKVIYTCITGDYDDLIEPEIISSGWDYVCFTDNPNLTSRTWKIKPMPEEFKNMSAVKQQRNVKIRPHKYLSEYDVSIWVDACVVIKGNLNTVAGMYKDNICLYQHPDRDCTYEEMQAIIDYGKDIMENMQPQIDRYRVEGFPAHYGLVQSNIILRRHNDKDCITLMEKWWEELKNGSHRDQLSFNYSVWKTGIKYSEMDKFIFNSKFFIWTASHKIPKIKKRKIVDGVFIY